MAVPIMAGASGLSLIKNWQYFTMDALPFFIVGFIAAFIFALVFTIKFVFKTNQSNQIRSVCFIPYYYSDHYYVIYFLILKDLTDNKFIFQILFFM